MPNVVLESLADGRPVIASAVGGVPELLEGGGGILVPAGDADAFAAAMVGCGRIRLGRRRSVRRAEATWRPGSPSIGWSTRHRRCIASCSSGGGSYPRRPIRCGWLRDRVGRAVPALWGHRCGAHRQRPVRRDRRGTVGRVGCPPLRRPGPVVPGDVAELVRCAACGLEYFPKATAGDPDFYRLLTDVVPYHADRWEFEHVLRAIPPGGPVLDLGCGDGAFLRAARARAATVVGVDHNEDAIEALRAAEIEGSTETFEAFASREPRTFDVVCSFHTLEHLPDAQALIEPARTAVRRGRGLRLGPEPRARRASRRRAARLPAASPLAMERPPARGARSSVRPRAPFRAVRGAGLLACLGRRARTQQARPRSRGGRERPPPADAAVDEGRDRSQASPIGLGPAGVHGPRPVRSFDARRVPEPRGGSMIANGRRYPTVLHLIPSLEIGGTERQLLGFIERSEAPGRHHVAVFQEPGALAHRAPNTPIVLGRLGRHRAGPPARPPRCSRRSGGPSGLGAWTSCTPTCTRPS